MTEHTSKIRVTAIDSTAAAFQSAARGMAELEKRAQRSAGEASRHFTAADKAISGLGAGRPLDKFDVALSSSERYMKRFSTETKKSMTSATEAVLMFGAKAATVLGGIGLEEALRHSYKEAANLSRGFSVLGNQLELNDKQLFALRNEFEQIGKVTMHTMPELVQGFQRFKNESQLSLEAAARVFPEIAKGAYAAQVPIDQWAKGIGESVRNFHIAEKDIPRAMDIIIDGVQKGDLEMGQLVESAPELASALEAAGVTGEKGLRTMLATLAELRKRTGSTSEAAQGLQQILQRWPEIMSAITGMPTDIAAKEFEDLKARGVDTFDTLMRYLDNATKSGRSLGEIVGPRMREPMRQLLDHWREVKKGVDEFDHSTGAVDRNFARLAKDQQRDLESMARSWESLTTAVGDFMASIGVPAGLQILADTVEHIASAVRVLRGLIDPNSPMFGPEQPQAPKDKRDWIKPTPGSPPIDPKELEKSTVVQSSLAPGLDLFGRDEAERTIEKQAQVKLKAERERIESPQTKTEQRSIIDRYWQLFHRTALEATEQGAQGTINAMLGLGGSTGRARPGPTTGGGLGGGGTPGIPVPGGGRIRPFGGGAGRGGAPGGGGTGRGGGGPVGPGFGRGYGGGMSKQQVVDYTRHAFAREGLDPDEAVRVAQSEGLNDYVGDSGTSFGPFQLHRGGAGSVGTEFERQTGKNLEDRSTIKDQIDFAAKWVKEKGNWGAWSGARNQGIYNATRIAPRDIPYDEKKYAGGRGAGALAENEVAPDQSNRPFYYGGQVNVGGETFDYGTGGRGRGSIPFGSYPIHIGEGDIGPIGQRIGSIATVGERGGVIDDPKYPGQPRAGVQIHPSSSDDLDRLYSQGCFAVARSQWPAFRSALLREAERHPGGLRLTINRNGMAEIAGREVAPKVVAQRGAEARRAGFVGSAQAGETPQRQPSNRDQSETPTQRVLPSLVGAPLPKSDQSIARPASPQQRLLQRQPQRRPAILPAQQQPREPDQIDDAHERARAMRRELERPININFRHTPDSEPLRRHSMAREVSRQIREARFASYSDAWRGVLIFAPLLPLLKMLLIWSA